MNEFRMWFSSFHLLWFPPVKVSLPVKIKVFFNFVLGRNDKLLGPSSSFFSCAIFFSLCFLFLCCLFLFFLSPMFLVLMLFCLFFLIFYCLCFFFTTCISCAHAFCFWFFCAYWFWFFYTSYFLFFNVFLCFSSCFSYKDLCVRKLGCEGIYLFHKVLFCYFIINVVLLFLRWTLFMSLFINCMEIVHGLCNYARPDRVVSFSWEAKDINKDLYFIF